MSQIKNKLLRARINNALRMVREGQTKLLARSVLPDQLFYFTDRYIIRTSEVRPLRRPLDRIKARWVGPEDEQALQAIRPRRVGYHERFLNNWRCVMGELDGQPASVIWFNFGSWHHSRRNAFQFQLGPKACWCAYVYVNPQFRRRGAFFKLWFESMNLLAKEGLERHYASVESHNSRALKLYLDAGSQIIYHYRVTRLGPLVYHSAQPAEGLDLPASKGLGQWIGRDRSVDPI